MKTALRSTTLSTGLAMFSMFFGAGNVVFPLAMGQYAQDKNLYALLGLLITAVGVPFIGLMAMTLFDGDHKKFFERIGKVPGFLISLLIMTLIGPLGAMPRLVALSYSTTSIFVPSTSLIPFSALSCVLIFLFAFRRNRILDILGYILTPVFLFSLVLLIAAGIFSASELTPTTSSALTAFFYGLQEGYNTMDLMGAFFFSSIVIVCLKKELAPEDHKDFRRLITMTLKASCIGALLLALVYVGTSFLAAYNSEILTSVPKEEILAALSLQILGPYGGIIAVATVVLACLTTAIALAAAFSEYVHEYLPRARYEVCLAATLFVTFFMSTLNFSGIMSFLAPILIVCYPALIVLSVANLLYKLYGFQSVKLPVFLVFLISLAVYWL